MKDVVTIEGLAINITNEVSDCFVSDYYYCYAKAGGVKAAFELPGLLYRESKDAFMLIAHKQLSDCIQEELLKRAIAGEVAHKRDMYYLVREQAITIGWEEALKKVLLNP